MGILKIIIIILFLIYSVLSIIYTIISKIKHCTYIVKKTIEDNKKKFNTTNKNNNEKAFITRDKLIKLFYIDSWIKWEILIWLIALVIMIIIVPIKCKNNVFIKGVSIVCMIIFFRGIAVFLCYRNKHRESFLDRVNSYLIKMMIYILYSSLFFVGFLQKLDNNTFFVLAIFMLLFFSICFLKNVIDEWNSFIFLMVNLLMIYIYDIVIFGFTFGFFYLSKNDTYSLFENVGSLLKLNTVSSYAIIINRGLYYFYTYPSIFNAENVFNACVPFFQYLFGATFNIAITGFFISYTASKAFSQNGNPDFNLLDQIKNKKFRVTVKKEKL